MKTFTPASERGATLLVVLILLILVTLMGLTTMRSSRLQQRMAGADADRALAFQSGELALRDAEKHVLSRLSSTSPFAAGCTAGLCLPPSDGSVLADSVDWDAKALRYGSTSGVAALGGVHKQPRYLIELLPDMPPPLGNSVKMSATGTAYRISAIGYGKQPVTRVVLQSTYYKP